MQKILYSEDTFRSDHLTHRPTLPATQPARHPTLPASRPCLPPLPLAARHPALPAYSSACPSSSGTTTWQTLQRASAVLVLLQRLYVWCASQSANPSNILLTSPIILCTSSKILHTLCNVPHIILYITHLKFYLPHLIVLADLAPPPIFYANLTCYAPLPPEVPRMVKCGIEPPIPCDVLACPCQVQLGAFQVAAHSKAPETVWLLW